MADLISSVIDAASAPMNTETLIQMVTNGTVHSISDITKVLRIAHDLPQLMRDLQSSLPAAATFIIDFGKKSQQVRDSLNEVLSQETATLENAARTRISAIQSLFQSQALSVLDSINAAFATATQILTKLPVGGNSVSVEVKVASYQRWSFISLDMPCLRSGRKSFTLGGFTQSFPYPEFYRCPYSEKIPWPNHHIPYIAIKFN